MAAIVAAFLIFAGAPVWAQRVVPLQRAPIGGARVVYQGADRRASRSPLQASPRPGQTLQLRAAPRVSPRAGLQLRQDSPVADPVELGFGLPVSEISLAQERASERPDAEALPRVAPENFALPLSGEPGATVSRSFNRTARRLSQGSERLAKPLQAAAARDTAWDDVQPLGHQIMGLLDSPVSGRAGAPSRSAHEEGGYFEAASGLSYGAAASGAGEPSSMLALSAAGPQEARPAPEVARAWISAAVLPFETGGRAEERTAPALTRSGSSAEALSEPVSGASWSSFYGMGGQAPSLSLTAPGSSKREPAPIVRLRLSVDGGKLSFVETLPGEARELAFAAQEALSADAARGVPSVRLSAPALSFSASESAPPSSFPLPSQAAARFSLFWLLAAIPFAARAAVRD